MSILYLSVQWININTACEYGNTGQIEGCTPLFQVVLILPVE
jgi:hypothetical protein